MTKVANLTLAQLAVQTTLPTGAQPCSLTDDNGSLCHGYEMPGGVLRVLAVITSSAADQATMNTATAAAATEDNKRTNAMTAVRAEVTRIRNIAAGSRTALEKFELGIAYLVLKEE